MRRSTEKGPTLSILVSEIIAKTFFNSYTSPLFSELHTAVSQPQIMLESSLMAHWKGTFVLFKTVFITPYRQSGPFFREPSHIAIYQSTFFCSLEAGVGAI
ncbi:hypothetical protein ACFE04_019387 [Oxalis oulophora]